MKKYVPKIMENNKRYSMTQNKFLQHVQKNENIN